MPDFLWFVVIAAIVTALAMRMRTKRSRAAAEARRSRGGAVGDGTTGPSTGIVASDSAALGLQYVSRRTGGEYGKDATRDRDDSGSDDGGGGGD